jgi:hypothetical protein
VTIARVLAASSAARSAAEFLGAVAEARAETGGAKQDTIDELRRIERLAARM